MGRMNEHLMGERPFGEGRRDVFLHIPLEEVDAEVGDREAAKVLSAVGDGDDGHLARIGRGDGVAGLFWGGVG